MREGCRDGTFLGLPPLSSGGSLAIKAAQRGRRDISKATFARRDISPAVVRPGSPFREMVV